MYTLRLLRKGCIWVQLNNMGKDSLNTPKKYIISSAICKNANELKTVQECFIFLNNLYKKSNNNKNALRMLEMASIYGKIPVSEFNWAVETVLTENIQDGFWLGEASIQYTSNGRSDQYKNVIEKSADNGNELSKFILSINS